MSTPGQQVAIRVDASVLIGSGHVMRCLALACELRRIGMEVVFVCRDVAGGLFQLIEQKGFVAMRLNVGRDLPAAWQEDAEATQLVLSGFNVDWLIVDHYLIDARWEENMRRTANRILAIDDLADRSHDCDALLDQNFFADMASRYSGRISPTCKPLLGPRYALLRREFQEARTRLPERGGAVRRILIFFGGSDAGNETAKALQALRILDRPEIEADVVVGLANSNRQQIEELCRLLPSVSLHCQIENMAELMLSADLAVGAGGITTWERCCLGLPSIVIAVAENQVDVARAMANAGWIQFMGRSVDVTAQTLAQALHSLIGDPARLRAFANKTLELVDARGAQRVAAVLRGAGGITDLQMPIELRYAAPDDERKLFEWRNEREVRAASFDDRLISWEEHTAWFRAVLQNPDRRLLIGEIDGTPIGVLRYDIVDKEAIASIYLLPGMGGKGLGTRLIIAGSGWVKHNVPQITRIRARILQSNRTSQRVFEKAGYVACGQDFIYRIEP